MVLHGDKLSVALGGKCMQRSHQVQFILAGGKEGVDDLHGNLDFDFGLLGILLVENMNHQDVTLLAYELTAIVALHSDAHDVFRSTDGFSARWQHVKPYVYHVRMPTVL